MVYKLNNEKMNTFYGENQENNIKMIKNNMTLDFNSANNNNKKAKLMKICVLESPDLKMLKLASPELEHLIIQNGLPTPSAVLPYFLKQENEVTEEQEMYVRPFVDALNQLHQNNGQQNQCLNENHNNSDKTNDNQRNSNSLSDGTTVTKFAVPQRPHIPSTHLTTNCSANKSSDDCSESYSSANECPALVNSDNSNKVLPPYSQSVTNNNSSIAQPIDMEDQERIKLERKRLRNRIAASKCRRRKLERISKLEDKVKGLKGENSELYIVVSKLRDQVCSLKQQVMDHVKFGCQLPVSQ